MFGFGGELHDGQRVFQHKAQIGRRRFELEFAGDDAGGVEQVFGHLLLRLCVAFDDLSVARDQLRIVRIRAREARVAEDGVERPAQFVRNDREEFVLGAVVRFGGLAQQLLLFQQPFALGFHLLALDEVGRLSGQNIHQAQIALRWLVRLAPVSGDHAKEKPGAGDQRGGLRRPDARLTMVLQRRCAGNEVTRLHVRHDDPMTDEPGNAARSPRIWTIQLENLAELRVESPKGQHPKSVLALIENLYTRHVGAHYGDGGVEDLLVQRLDIALLNHFDADFLERLGSGEFRGQPLFALAQRRCRLLGLLGQLVLANGGDQQRLVHLAQLPLIVGFRRGCCCRAIHLGFLRGDFLGGRGDFFWGRSCRGSGCCSTDSIDHGPGMPLVKAR